MIRIILLLCYLFISSSAVAEDNSPHKTYDGQIACVTYADMALAGKLAEQGDTAAFKKMLMSKRCYAFKAGQTIYKIDKIDIYTQVRLKGGTRLLWTVMK